MATDNLSLTDEKMTVNINPYLSFLQRPCVAIFLQTFRFNSELNNGIPKHSSRGTQSASVVATTRQFIVINHICIYKFLIDQGFLTDIQKFSDSSYPWGPPMGFTGERTSGIKKESLLSKYMLLGEGTEFSTDAQNGLLPKKLKINKKRERHCKTSTR